MLTAERDLRAACAAELRGQGFIGCVRRGAEGLRSIDRHGPSLLEKVPKAREIGDVDDGCRSQVRVLVERDEMNPSLPQIDPDVQETLTSNLLAMTSTMVREKLAAAPTQVHGKVQGFGSAAEVAAAEGTDRTAGLSRRARSSRQGDRSHAGTPSQVAAAGPF
jgi:hypothetical protein